MKKKVIKSLVIIVVLSIFFVPFTMSIYKNAATGSSNIIFADWNVSLNQNNVNNHLSISPNGTNASYTVNISSTSKVDMEYSIVINHLPTGVSVSLDNGSFVTEVDNTVTFSNVGTILYSDVTKTRSHTLTFKAESNAVFVNDQSVNIKVITKQII